LADDDTSDQEEAISSKAEGGESAAREPGIGAIPGQAARGAAKHEFDANDRTNAHRLVATGMLITFLVVAIKQDWWTHLRDWITVKTHGAATVTTPGGTDQTAGGSANPANPTGAF
jgi:hypothetical protein